ncbi:MAG TPA: DUF5678 domain-containing protein [Gemmataceae bacterium]|nr:DUF5678 domain-containing protein [Gemmataceae bacterium]
MNGPTDKPSLGALALATYRRDLARLLEERPGQWVAYHGDQLVGFAKTQRELVEECIRRGYRGRDYLVDCIEPELPDIIDSPYPFE